MQFEISKLLPGESLAGVDGIGAMLSHQQPVYYVFDLKLHTVTS